ncbi:hypothetical protein V9T40_007453 [Parthenolecanium corni]|uniref:Cuticle protein CPCFC domain-containing protein n=1 Tax=Parthenolecanium corni TaxID=536013 RepID=A0AAN9TV25_9HEMI
MRYATQRDACESARISARLPPAACHHYMHLYPTGDTRRVWLWLWVMMGCALPASSQSYQSNSYPAGLHPSLCPHYPYCDNALLGGFARQVAAIHEGGAGADAAPGYPASLSPHACPNYPFCSHHIPPEALHYSRRGPPSAAPAHYALRRSAPLARYPSGVDPATCPNYPYCH